MSGKQIGNFSATNTLPFQVHKKKKKKKKEKKQAIGKRHNEPMRFDIQYIYTWYI